MTKTFTGGFALRAKKFLSAVIAEVLNVFDCYGKISQPFQIHLQVISRHDSAKIFICGVERLLIFGTASGIGKFA